MPRWAKITLGALGGVLVLLVAGVLFLTQSDAGRARVRGVLVGGLQAKAHGIVKVGPIHGNLLTGATIDGLVITDSTGAPFFRADTIQIRYSLLALLRQRINLAHVRLVHPVVVLDRPPGLAWNFARIFPSDTTKPPTRQGFGAWISLRDLAVVGGRVIVRNEWSPPDSLAGAARARAVAQALSPDSRLWVVRVPKGFQSIQDYRQLNGRFDRLRLADPDSAAMIFDVAHLSLVALPFRPPAAIVRDLSGRVISAGDTLSMQGVKVTLPGSSLAISGGYLRGPGSLQASAQAAPVAFQDFRFLYPDLPVGGGTIDASVDRATPRTHLVVRKMALAVETARLAGNADVSFGDSLRLGPSNLTFSGVDTRLVHRLAPAVTFPRQGVLAGRMALTGTPAALRVDGNVAFTDRASGLSRLYADGEIGTVGGFRARDLRLRLAPVQLALLSSVGPKLPVGGLITGQATLTGSAASGFDFQADLAHQDAAVGRSHLTARGAILRRAGAFAARDLRLRLDPLQVAVARAFKPDLPLSGTVTGTATLDGTPKALRLVADLVHQSATTGRSRLLADGGVSTSNGFRARGLRLRFDPLQVALVKAFKPDLALSGVVTGTTTLTGTPADLALVADVVHDSGPTGRSHLLAAGGVGFGSAFRARDLRLRFEPVQVALARAFKPDLPVTGTLSGGATVTGSTATLLSLAGDVTHDATTGRSRLAGTATVPFGGRSRVSVDVRALPVSLATLGRFAPSAELHGSATGTIRATGTMRDLALAVGLAVQNGGTIDATGRLDLASARKGYDVVARFGGFDAHAMTLRAPATLLTGTASAVGRGTDPATMTATLAADLTGVRAGKVDVDSVRLLTRLADGLATVDRGAVRLASAQADVQGSFGLVAGRSGSLSYRVKVDTLSQFKGFVPPDSVRVPPRPALNARAIQQARADSARIARATEVERSATGQPAPPKLQVDTVRPLPRDSLAGSLDATGTLAGNLKRFDVRGSAVMKDLVAFGSMVGSGAVDYSWLNAPATNSQLALDARMRAVRASGFALDSVGAVVRYTGLGGTGSGMVDLAVRQDPRRDYRARADFTLSPERKQLRYSDLTLRFDTTVWQAPHPGAVSWAGGGVELENVELQSSDGGRISADGRLPANGPADLRLAVDRLEIGDVIALLQDSVRVRGKLSLAATVRGTGASPIVAGTAGLVGAVVDTLPVPDAQARFDYANRQLQGSAELTQNARTLLTATGRLPINLAISGVTGPRLAPDAPLELDVRADSLPLEALPSFTSAVSDVRGRVVGTMSVRGTRTTPDVRGLLNLDLGSLRVVQPGLALKDIAGTVRIEGDTAVVDSITAQSGSGPIRLAGGLDLHEITRPGFDLKLTANDAQVLNNQQGKLDASADLTMTGPWTGARVAGTVHVMHGVIYAPEQANMQRIDFDAPDLTALGDTAALRVFKQTNQLLSNLRVNVEVVIEPNTWVRNSQANVEIYTPHETGALAVGMDRATESLTLNGTINTDRGEYTFGGRRIKLTHGAVVFLGESPIDPILQLTAEQEVRLPNRPAFAIQLLVGGTMRTPRLTLESNAQPPIPESDLLSYFAFGESSSSLLQPDAGGSIGGGSSGSGALLGPVGALATQQLGVTAVGTVVDQVEVQTRRALSLDVFNITPAPLPPELAVQGYLNVFRGAQFEAGRYLSNRWFLAGQGRTALVRPGARLEYRTQGGFQWVTSWEPRYLAQQPTLTASQNPRTASVLGIFLQWQRRF